MTLDVIASLIQRLSQTAFYIKKEKAISCSQFLLLLLHPLKAHKDKPKYTPADFPSQPLHQALLNIWDSSWR